jgi:hypothetical protein
VPKKNGEPTETTLADVVKAINALASEMRAGFEAITSEQRQTNTQLAAAMRKLTRHEERIRKLESRSR